MKTLALLLVAWCLAAPAHGQAALSAAQALYAAAQYDDALKAFEALKAEDGQPPRLAVEQGRAFCLLALDRKADAEQAIETIVALDPFFSPSEDDTPPKFRAAFRDVRRRVLAGALQQVYQRAKAAYERKAYTEALATFGQVLKLLEDPDLVLDASARSDMRLVAHAFEDLAKAASAPAALPPPAAASPDRPAANDTPAGQGTPAPPATAANQKGPQPGPLYDVSAKDVTAPVPQRTDVSLPVTLRQALSGGEVVVELIVAPTGMVESATARQSSDPVLSALVVRAVLLDWRYRPATKGGTPVRYRMMAKVVVTKVP